MGIISPWDIFFGSPNLSFQFLRKLGFFHPSFTSTFFAGCSPFSADAEVVSSSRARFWPAVDSEGGVVAVVVLAGCGEMEDFFAPLGELELDLLARALDSRGSFGSSVVAWTIGTPL